MKRIFLFILIMAMALFGFCACNKTVNIPSAPKSFDVTFSTSYLTQSVNAPDKQNVKSGENATAPVIDAQATAGYEFIWTLDIATKEKFDFATPITKNIELFAVETPRNYRILYLSDLSLTNENVTTYTMLDEITLVAPKMPFGYRFEKWCYAEQKESNVTTIVKGTMGDIVLRAVYQTVNYAIEYRLNPDGFDTNGRPISLTVDNKKNPTYYAYGSTITFANPTCEETDYTFVGWKAYSEKGINLSVTTLSPTFVKENWSKLSANGSSIILQACWEKVK